MTAASFYLPCGSRFADRNKQQTRTEIFGGKRAVPNCILASYHTCAPCSSGSDKDARRLNPYLNQLMTNRHTGDNGDGVAASVAFAWEGWRPEGGGLNRSCDKLTFCAADVPQGVKDRDCYSAKALLLGGWQVIPRVHGMRGRYYPKISTCVRQPFRIRNASP
jgi:hypothetical protein